jgi:hypothetical protein
MYFAEKSENRKIPHDFEDLMAKGDEHYPEKNSPC